MKFADIDAIKRALQQIPPCDRILVFSPAWDAHGDGRSEDAAVSAAWPASSTEGCPRSRWDLDNAAPQDVPRCDVGLICNTFMCSRDPELWLRNIAPVVSTLIVQDLAVSSRSSDRHLSPETGDIARYSVSSHGIIGETDPGHRVFDISAAGYPILHADSYGEDG